MRWSVTQVQKGALFDAQGAIPVQTVVSSELKNALQVLMAALSEGPDALPA